MINTSTVTEAFGILREVAKTSKTTEKKAWLMKGKSNKVLESILRMCYDPDMVYNVTIKNRDFSMAISIKPEVDNFYDFLQLLADLHTRKFTGHAAIRELEHFFSKCTEEEYTWYSRCIDRDLRAGVNIKMVESFLSDSGLPKMNVFKCQLAKPFEEKRLPKRFSVQTKLDGYRLFGFVSEGGQVDARTRNGSKVKGYTEIEKQLAKLPAGYVYDGEIMASDESFNSTQSDAFKHADDKEGIFKIFDVLPTQEFLDGKSSLPLWERIEYMNEVLAPICDELTCVKLLEYSEELTGEDGYEQALAIHSKNVSLGEEGTMLKDLDAMYRCTRSYDVQKLKEFETIDLPIIDILPGKKGTKNENTFGSFVVDFEGNPVNVRGRISDKLAGEIWESRESLIGSIIEVSYQNITTNKKGTKSMRFPVFTRFRLDK